MRKRILFLTPQLPYPPQQGTAIRNYNLVRQVARWHEVHLLSFADPPAQGTSAGPLRDLCATVTTVPTPRRNTWQRLWTTLTSSLPDMHHRLYSRPMYQQLQALSNAVHPDVIQVEGLEMAQYGLHVWQLTGKPPPLLVFDAHNAEHLLQKCIFETDAHRPSRWLGALYSWIQWQRLQGYEAAVCRQANRVVACSSADAHSLTTLVPGLEPIIVPNGVDTESYCPGGVAAASLERHALVFTGKMDFRPNVDAALWFCSDVLPLVVRVCPEAHLYIVGKSPHPRLAPLKQVPNVTVTGFVEDVRPYIAGATVYVVPLLAGGGTRLKVLEAMSMGKAIVSTTLGCQGIHARHGRDIVLADHGSDFARQVSALLTDEARRNELGQAARSFVEEHFDWRTVTTPLEQVYEGEP